MKKIINTIDKLDIFGVPISLLTDGKATLHKSKLGGIVTILIGSISLTYFLYVMVLWINHQIPPIVSFKQQTISYAELKLSNSIIQLEIQDFLGDVDPFRKENNIITPNLYRVTTINEKPIPLFSSEDKPFKISIDNGTLVLNHDDTGSEDRLEMTQFLLVLESCSNLTAVPGSYCADENVINQYISKFHGLLFLTIKLNQLNYSTGELEEIKKQYYTALEPSRPLYSQVMLKQQETIIDNGILFNNYKKYYFLNNYELINQQVDNFFISQVISQMSRQKQEFKSFGCYLFRIDNIAVSENIALPKLGQILAQVGSIVQVIFLLKYIAVYYNKMLLENQLLFEIVTMYYPEIKKIKLNYFNQLEIKQNSQNSSEYSIQNIKYQYQTFSKRAKEKCRLNNILYEISRLQFIIQQQFGDQVLQQSHQMGGKLSNNCLDHQNSKESNRLTVKPANSLDIENEYILLDPQKYYKNNLGIDILILLLSNMTFLEIHNKFQTNLILIQINGYSSFFNSIKVLISVMVNNDIYDIFYFKKSQFSIYIDLIYLSVKYQQLQIGESQMLYSIMIINLISTFTKNCKYNINYNGLFTKNFILF
ncbi:unnamed protein product [Paramecium pentaurelia]|uniref:Transmembrane protein n=1 Tax=Paramecium pentaurelia TaxID=43138 RepID=A0A8S1WI16_9CILI|nr:unnamed protein product [Paramecium pentaurelia]